MNWKLSIFIIITLAFLTSYESLTLQSSRELLNKWLTKRNYGDDLNYYSFICNDNNANALGTMLIEEDYLGQFITTKAIAYNLCKSGSVLCNGKKIYSCRIPNPGDLVEVFNYTDTVEGIDSDKKFIDITDANLEKLVSFTNHLLNEMQNPPLKILYEDDSMAIVFKPSGVHTRPYLNSIKKKTFTLKDSLAILLTPPSNNFLDALPTPTPVHRLDSRVAGCVVVAKTRSSLSFLSKQFAERLVTKEYKAILCGKIHNDLRLKYNDESNQGDLLIDIPIDNNPSTTRLKILAEYYDSVYGTVTVVKLEPISGRTHQLRIHCSALNCPIVGDDLYHGNLLPEQVRKGTGLYLMCKSVTIRHPLNLDMIKIEVDDLPVTYFTYSLTTHLLTYLLIRDIPD